MKLRVILSAGGDEEQIRLTTRLDSHGLLGNARGAMSGAVGRAHTHTQRARETRRRRGGVASRGCRRGLPTAELRASRRVREPTGLRTRARAAAWLGAQRSASPPLRSSRSRFDGTQHVSVRVLVRRGGFRVFRAFRVRVFSCDGD